MQGIQILVLGMLARNQCKEYASEAINLGILIENPKQPYKPRVTKWQVLGKYRQMQRQQHSSTFKP